MWETAWCVLHRPYSIVLFDEIEKAHPDVFNILLQVLDGGQLTDSYGRTVSFQNVVLIITSNLGTSRSPNAGSLGFQRDSETAGADKMKSRVLEEVKKTFNPEFVNRLDEIVVFHSLDKEHIRKIADIQLAELNERLKEKDFSIRLDADAKEWLINKGYDPAYGARHLRRSIQTHIEDPLSLELLRRGFEGNDEIIASLENDHIVFRVKAGV